MATARRWSAVKDDAVTAGLLDAEAVSADVSVLRGQVRAWRLAEVRKRQKVTQAELAAAIRVNQGRISQIEHGDIDATGVGTLAKYVAGLGGTLRVVADFGDEQLSVRS